MKQMQKKSEDAISPVVGVMLMIVVTVIIAAVITAFATGTMGDEPVTTPVVKIEQINANSYGGYLQSVEFIHKGGDVLLWENVEFSLVDKDGYIITNYFPGTYGTVKISGKEGAGVTAEAGDYIKVIIDATGTANPRNAEYPSGNTVEWVMYDKRTEGIIASGDFIVP